jgi:hypothetical protein
MGYITGQGTIWNLPNYAGRLFTADAEATPFLSMIGGLTGGRSSDNFEFPCGQTYDYPSATQPVITETASLTAPASPTQMAMAQVTNVCQKHHESILLSYDKLANMGRMSGLNTVGQVNPISAARQAQIAWFLKKIARDVEYSFLKGTYSLATTAGTYNATRGIITACSTTAVAAASAQLSKKLLDTMFKTMFDGGAMFGNMVLFVNSYQKQGISNIYGYSPMDRNVGGVNLKQIETDFGVVGIALDRHMPTDTVLAADMSVCAPVFQMVPEKGNFFYEPLSKTGASENGQIYGYIGLDYGCEFLHGKITGLATS